MVHKIIIDNKEIEISDESYKKLKESLIPKKFKWEYPKDKSFFIGETYVSGNGRGDVPLSIDYGRYRKTKGNALKSLLRNKQANRLEALVEQLQGSMDGNNSIYLCENGEYQYAYDDNPDIGTITMQRETARKICDMLNNGEFSLDGEL